MSFDILGTSCDQSEARFNKSHIRKVYACLAVTCHLHFWQNDRDLLLATVVTRGWNGYRNKSQHRKSTLEKKILPPFQQGFEPATFQSRVRTLTTELSPPPISAAQHSASSYELASARSWSRGKCMISPLLLRRDERHVCKIWVSISCLTSWKSQMFVSVVLCETH